MEVSSQLDDRFDELTTLRLDFVAIDSCTIQICVMFIKVQNLSLHNFGHAILFSK